MRFDGKVIFVTGGALGIGRAVCEIVAERGGAVSIVDVDQAAGEELCSSIQRAGGKAAFTRADVASFENMQSAAEATNTKFGAINSLVVSAGIQRYGTAVSTDDSQWNEVLNVNLKGAWNAARATIPFMRSAGGGTIVNVSSVQALASQQNVLAYTVSKHGLLGLTRSICVRCALRSLSDRNAVP